MESTSEPGAGPPPSDMESASEPGAGPAPPDIESASEQGARPQSPSTRWTRNWFVFFSFAIPICWVVVVLALMFWHAISNQMLLILCVGTAVVCLIARVVMKLYDRYTSMQARDLSIEQRFPTFVASAREGSDDLCAICLEAKIDSQRLRRMVCKHDFHKQCFDHWVLHSPSHNKKNEEVRCPLCRNRELW
mmetsp:Transcript_134403/g.429406  ORF Transcript_134403/g.429406 Transcript_134403/m.429406 type:complete len:191 (+) Transcript_134403:3-575(+)